MNNIDPTFLAATTVVALAAKPIIQSTMNLAERLLGPSADMLGDHLATFAEKRMQNTSAILENAAKKIDNFEARQASDSVHPKVFFKTINEGSLSDDPCSVEYFGGVLASAYSGIGRDDRGVYFNAIITNLSVYQLRFHYFFYKVFKHVYNGHSSTNLQEQAKLESLRVLISAEDYFMSMKFSEAEREIASSIQSHIINGLTGEKLVSSSYYSGPVLAVKKIFPDATGSECMMFSPSQLGLELFYWVHGKGNEDYGTMLNTKTVFEDFPDLEISTNTVLRADSNKKVTVSEE